MLIVDSQIHIWENETMNPTHRQVRTYSADDALAEMREAGVGAALLHPPSTLPNTNATAIAAAKEHPDKFAILGHFALEKPENRGLVATWKQQPGMLGFRFTFNQPHQRTWWTDGTVDWLWPGRRRPARRSDCSALVISKPSRKSPNGIPVCAC
jgi:predicted TIM-barrel fold metal-dependent hydrolase